MTFARKIWVDLAALSCNVLSRKNKPPLLRDSILAERTQRTGAVTNHEESLTHGSRQTTPYRQ